MADVADYAHDAALFGARPNDVLANRILTRPQRPRHRLVDDHDHFRRCDVAGGDVSSSTDRNSHRREVAVADHPRERRRVTATLVGDAFRARSPRAISSKGKRVSDPSPFDAGKRFDLSE